MITAIISIALGLLNWTFVNKKIWILHSVIDLAVFRVIHVEYGVRIGFKSCYSQDNIVYRQK